MIIHWHIDPVQGGYGNIFFNSTTFHYSIREIASWAFRINDITVFNDIVMKCFFCCKRTSKIFYLINDTLADRHGTNDIAIGVLFASFLQNFA